VFEAAQHAYAEGRISKESTSAAAPGGSAQEKSTLNQG